MQTLIAQIGNVLDLQDVDNGLDDYRSTPSLSFDQFRFYLFKEASAMGVGGGRELFNRVPTLCPFSACTYVP